MLGDLCVINQLYESVPTPMVYLEQIVQLFSGATLFFTLDLLQGYLRCPLRDEG